MGPGQLIWLMKAAHCDILLWRFLGASILAALVAWRGLPLLSAIRCTSTRVGAVLKKGGR